MGVIKANGSAYGGDRLGIYSTTMGTWDIPVLPRLRLWNWVIKIIYLYSKLLLRRILCMTNTLDLLFHISTVHTKVFLCQWSVFMIDGNVETNANPSITSPVSQWESSITQIARFMGPTWAHQGPTGPRWAPWWPHELCFMGKQYKTWTTFYIIRNDRIKNRTQTTQLTNTAVRFMVLNFQSCSSVLFWLNRIMVVLLSDWRSIIEPGHSPQTAYSGGQKSCDPFY